MINELMFIPMILLAILSPIADGIVARKYKVGWMHFHVLKWASRDLVIASYVIYNLFNNMIFSIILIFLKLLHSTIYRWAVVNTDLFYGNTDPPEWWRRLKDIFRRAK